jgi:gliding motility-associated-like protein
MKKPLLASLTFIYFIFIVNINAQKDTEFWFAAPEVSNGYAGGNFDAPVRFILSTYDQSATVTLSQPANSSFTPIVQIVNSNTSGEFVFYAPDLQFIENDQPNVIRNIGFKITSTAPISVYYEVIGLNTNNPELYSLKGKNALGTVFYVPFQTEIDNSLSYSPQPYATFDIVATEDNTNVKIKPTKDLIGHVANVQFSVTLDKGETYSSWSENLSGIGHPSGSKITSDKPIAITMKDDLLEGGMLYGGFCRDQMGDQLIPVDKTGTKYVLQRGLLNGIERAYVVGTADNTQIKLNGNVFATINEGETATIFIDEQQFFIETDAPVYVLQMTGTNCEVAGEILPPLDCTGSSSIRFVRSSYEPFYMFIVTKQGNEGGFRLNGNTNLLPSAIFSPIPGSNGEFVGTVTEFSESEVASNQSSIVENSLGVFQMGFLNGGTVTGSRFGFFSDFGNRTNVKDSLSLCSGESSFWRGFTIMPENSYFDTTQTLAGCDTIYELKVKLSASIFKEKEILLCQGEFYNFNGVLVSAPAILKDTLPAMGQVCDTILTINLKNKPSSIKVIDIQLCQNSTYYYKGIEYFAPNTILDTLMAMNGCDSFLTIYLNLAQFATISREIAICPNENTVINGNTYNQASVIIDTLSGIAGCDTIRTNTIVLKPLPDKYSISDTSVCENMPITLNSNYQNTTWNNSISSQTYEVTDTGTVSIKVTNNFGCSRTDFIKIRPCCFDKPVKTPNAFTPNNDGLNDYFKPIISEGCNTYKFSIYDRWGAILFTGNETSLGWDGKNQDKLAPMDVYIWVLEYKTKGATTTKIEKGDVTVIR